MEDNGGNLNVQVEAGVTCDVRKTASVSASHKIFI